MTGAAIVGRPGGGIEGVCLGSVAAPRTGSPGFDMRRGVMRHSAQKARRPFIRTKQARASKVDADGSA
jgi:hypothetical protein